MSSYSLELMDRAFDLAYFIHRDAELSLTITMQALAKLELAVEAQDRRRYYNLRGRVFSGKIQKLRTKVSMNEAHLLQRLVYIESEHHERLQERASGGNGLLEEDMIVRFIKHLVKIAVRRNSFYVTAGLSRLLYSYSTSEAMDIYGLVVQEPDRVKDDHYYRSRKKRLMEELGERFGGFLKTVRGHRGEERFQQREDSSRLAGMVRECLDLFTPWNTKCVLPDRFDPTSEPLSQLHFQGGEPDNEHSVETKRIHSILHPDCFERLTRALGFGTPDERLAVPQFFLENNANHDNPRRGSRHRAPGLTEEQRKAVVEGLADLAARRRKVSAGLLSIRVDGVEKALLDPARESIAQLELPEIADAIEVYANDVLLAVCLLSYGNSQRAQHCSIVLEGGREVSFDVSVPGNEQGEAAGARVQISYSEKHPIRATLLLSQRLLQRLSLLVGSLRIRNRWVLGTALSVLLIIGLAVGIAYYKRLGNRTPVAPGSEQASSNPPSQGLSPEAPDSVPQPSPGSPADVQPGSMPKPGGPGVRRRQPQRPQVARSGPVPAPEGPGRDSAADKSPDSVVADEATREGGPRRSPTNLASVKKVYLKPIGQGPFSSEVAEMLARQLVASGRWSVDKDAETADAAIRFTVGRRTIRIYRGRKMTRGEVSFQLLDPDGRAIYPSNGKEPNEKLRGSAAEVAAMFVAHLVAASQQN
jgi:hypothetical protein